jgi:molecular chaperone DnaK (HSP70)
MDEDFFVPTKNGKGTKIDTLPGATNLGEIEDVRYYRDKLLAALKIPKDYIVEKDKSPERKANLSQLDVKFGRTIQRVQQNIATGLENIAKRHLQLRGYPESLIRDLRIELPDPSDMIAKRKLDLDQQKAQVIQAVMGLGLFSKDEILRQYYEMNDEEIARMKEDVEKEQQEQMQKEADQSQMQAQATAQGQAEGEAAVPQPQQESSKSDNLTKLLEFTTDDNKKKVLERIINKQSSKIKIEK